LKNLCGLKLWIKEGAASERGKEQIQKNRRFFGRGEAAELPTWILKLKTKTKTKTKTKKPQKKKYGT
jgi:hypothetical protein